MAAAALEALLGRRRVWCADVMASRYRPRRPLDRCVGVAPSGPRGVGRIVEAAKDLLRHGGDHPEFFRGEQIDEKVADTGHVVGRGGLDGGLPGIGDDRQRAPAIVGAPAPFNQASFGHAGELV